MVRGADALTELRALYVAAAEAEQARADERVPSGGVLTSGDPLARVLLLKGEPGPADLEAGEALAGADGDAARAALEALGVPAAGLLALVSRPSPGTRPADAASRVALYLESADPRVAVALDRVAAEDLAAAAGVPPLPFGERVRTHGRVLLAVDGLEASLEDPVRKKRVWSQLKGLRA